MRSLFGRKGRPDIEALARSQYGIRCRAHELDGERDQNVRLDGEDGVRHVLKIAHPSTGPDEQLLQ